MALEGAEGSAMIKAIETRYKGYRFRSRLEARWAVFFDALGVEWEYEKEGYDLGELGYYLPDFYLPEWGTFIEIKGGNPTKHEILKLARLANFLNNGRNLCQRIANISETRDASEEKYDAAKSVYLFWGTPGMPEFKFKSTGRWKLKSGCIGISIPPLLEEMELPLATSLFAKCDGGRKLDIWPLYSGLSEEERSQFLSIYVRPADLPEDVFSEMVLNLCYPFGLMRRTYTGRGVLYEDPEILKAYDAARSARFEHGEHP
jgi:hypothetical protein